MEGLGPFDPRPSEDFIRSETPRTKGAPRAQRPPESVAARGAFARKLARDELAAYPSASAVQMRLAAGRLGHYSAPAEWVPSFMGTSSRETYL